MYALYLQEIHHLKIPSGNQFKEQNRKQEYNIIKVNVDSNTKVLHDNRKEPEMRIPKKPMGRKHGINLRSITRVDYDQLLNSKKHKLMQLPKKSHTPNYVGEALNRKTRTNWIERLCYCFDKMYISGTLICKFLRNKVPE